MSLNVEHWTLGFGAGARAFGLVGEWESMDLDLDLVRVAGVDDVWVFGCLGV